MILFLFGAAVMLARSAPMAVAVAAVDGEIAIPVLVRNWAVDYLGNLIGATGLAVTFSRAGMIGAPFSQTAARIAFAKIALYPCQLLVENAVAMRLFALRCGPVF